MAIAVGKNPAVFVHEKEMIVSIADERFQKTPLSQITEVNSLGPVLKTVVSRGLLRLTELGISFSISVDMERDAEDEDWSYALVKINIDSEDIDIIRDEIIKYAYEEMDPFDATKVLLVLENV
jgi:hypothetical protein